MCWWWNSSWGKKTCMNPDINKYFVAVNRSILKEQIIWAIVLCSIIYKWNSAAEMTWFWCWDTSLLMTWIPPMTVRQQSTYKTILTWKSKNIRVFPKWNKNSLNSANSKSLINHWSMNWAQFKDPVSHMCLAGVVVASCLLHNRWLGGRFKPF